MEAPPLEESQTIARAQTGDVAAYANLVRLYQEIAFRTAYLITGDAAEAEEAAQDAFVKAFRALARFRSDAPFRPWLLQIVVNEARNRRKASRRRTGLALRVGADMSPDNHDPSPETMLLAAEQRTELLALMAGLRDEERLALAYRYFLDLSETEMADALRCPRGTVKSRISRALGHLRDAFNRSPTSEGGRHGR